MYLNYGDLTEKFQKYVDEYKKQTKQSSIENLKTQDLTELKKILTRFPEFKKLSNNILKHLTLIGEIEKQITSQNLWTVGELQQTILCDLEDHSTIKSKLVEVISDTTVSSMNKVKLILLFIYKFPKNPTDHEFLISRVSEGIPPGQINLLRRFTKSFATFSTGTQSTAGQNNIGQIFYKNKFNFQQLFNNDNKKSITPKHDNIYMQYVPQLSDILTEIISPRQEQGQREKEPENHHIGTYIPDVVSRQYGNGVTSVPQQIIVYFKGGVTYEEARLVHEISAHNTHTKLIIGGDKLLNSEQWLAEMVQIVNQAPATPRAQSDRSAQLREIL